MPNKIRGVGLFTAENIVAIIIELQQHAGGRNTNDRQS